MTIAQSDDEEREPPDYAEVYVTLMTHAGMSFSEVGDRTIAQLEAIMSRLGKHISLRAGIPFEEDEFEDSPPKLSDVAAFCGAFSGI